MNEGRLRKGDLGIGAPIGGGGQGKVYDAPAAPRQFGFAFVYKEYRPSVLADLDVGVLGAMPAYVAALPTSEGLELLSVAAWPCRLVESRGAVTGFVMQAIPDDFYLPAHKPQGQGTERDLGEFQHLLNRPGLIARLGIPLTDRNRYELLAEVARALDIFHRHNIAVGDLSPKNLLFSLRPYAKVYFIDCDAMRFKGRSVMKQVETPEWEVRAANPGEDVATPKSDAYKLGLLALRLLSGSQSLRKPDQLPKGRPPEIRRLIARSLSPRPEHRPRPAEWIQPLERVAKTASTKPPPAPTPKPPAANPATGPPGVGTYPPRPAAAVPSPPPARSPALPAPPTTPRIRAAGVIAAAAFVAAAGLEITADWDWWRSYRWPPFDWDNRYLLAQLLSLVGMYRYSGHNRHRAELFGVLVAGSVAYYYVSADPFSFFRPGTDFQGLLSLSVASYGVSALAALAWSALSFAARRKAPPPTTQQVAILIQRDRATVRRLAWTILTCAVPVVLGFILLITPLRQDLGWDYVQLLFRASPLDMVVAAAANGVPVPPMWAGFILLERGMWSYRRAGLIRGLALVLAGAAAWSLGGSVVGTFADDARRVTETTPVPGHVVEGGRFCGRYWTSASRTARFFIAGEACETLYRYDGWYEAWSKAFPNGDIEDLLSMDGTLITLIAPRGGSGLIAVAVNEETGDSLWEYDCSGRLTYDETQLDAGPSTPPVQEFAGTCDDQPFRLDPSTGRSPALTGPVPATIPPGAEETSGVEESPAVTATIPPNPGDAVNCADFDSHAAAQEWFDTYRPHYGDVALIDINENGVACEALLTDAERATTTTRR